MNKNTLLVLGILVLVALGLVFYSTRDKVEDLPDDNNGIVTNPPVNDNEPVEPTPPREAGAPVVTTDSKATPAENSVVLTGKVNPNGASTRYWYEYSLSSSPDSKTGLTDKQFVGSGFLSINAPVYIVGLTKDTKYYFRLVAENSFGKVSGAQYSFQTVAGTPPLVGGVPDARTSAASGISRNAATLNGKVNPSNANTQFWFEYGTTANLGKISAFGNVAKDVDGLDYDATKNVSLPISGLEADTTYYFQLIAQNMFGTVSGSVLTFKTPAGPATVSPTVKTKAATDVGASTAQLHGSVAAGGAETSYWFEYSTNSLLGSVLLQSTTPKSAGAGTASQEVEADISGLNSDTNYYFRLVARNSKGTILGDKLSFKTE